MSQEIPPSDIHSFYEFLGRRIEVGEQKLTPEESVKEFREYCREVERFIRETNESIESGQSKPLDHEALMERVRQRLTAEGITD